MRQSAQLIITGEVSIEPCGPGSLARVRGHHITIMIMGPTGSGKSTFIEALAGKDQSLGISKDQLAGFTQDVTAYEMVNTKIQDPSGESYPVWLIDTPGFSDSKISELEIIREAKSWIWNQTNYNSIDLILYLCPITDTRVPGSKRRTIEMLQSLFGITRGSSPRVTILTTMWDTLGHPHTRERAEKHFAQLRDDVWKDVVSRGGNIARFHNTQESALEVLKASMENPHDVHLRNRNQATYPLYYNRPTISDSYFPSLYQELLDRVNNCQREMELLQMDEAQLTTNPDPQLAAVVIPKRQEIEQDLVKFLKQLVEVGAVPEGFACRAAQLVSQYLLTGLTEDTREDDAKFSAAVEHRIEELKVFNDAYIHGPELFGSCWPYLHPKAKFIIFDNLVKLIKTRQQEDRSHYLDSLRQIVTTTHVEELEREILISLDLLNEDRGKIRWQLEHFNPPPSKFAEVRAQLVYRYLLDDVNDAKGIAQIFQDALKQLHGQSDNGKQRKTILKAELAKAKDTLKQSALALIKYGSPPDGYERVVFDYRELSVKGYVAQAKWIAKERFGKNT